MIIIVRKEIQVWRSNGYENQGKGYGKALIDFLASKYADEYSVLQVGTGDSPLTIPFYEKCGFVRSHKIPNFFTDNYDHTIYICLCKYTISISCTPPS